MIETRGLVALVEGTDAMLKAANVELVGPMTQVGNESAGFDHSNCLSHIF